MGSLDAFGWGEYFEVVILSSRLKIRKPSPQPFLEAAQCMNLSPGKCAYLGNRISKDIPGCKQAGYAMTLIIELSAGLRVDEQDQALTPDAVIHSLSELLNIFPARV